MLHFLQIFVDAFKMHSVLPISGGSIAITSLYTHSGAKWLASVCCIFIGVNLSFVANYFFGQLGFSFFSSKLKPKQKSLLKRDEKRITFGIALLGLIFAIFNNPYTPHAITLGGLLSARKNVTLPIVIVISLIVTILQVATLNNW